MADAAHEIKPLPEIAEAQKSGKFMVGITFIDKNGDLQHRLITQNFPPTEMRRSHEEIEKLIVEEIKRMLKKDMERGGKGK